MFQWNEQSIFLSKASMWHKTELWPSRTWHGERKKTLRTSHEKRLNQITILLTKKANECYGKFNKDNQCTYLRATKINFNARN